MFKKLFSIGLRDENPEYLNRKIYHTNVVAFIFISVFTPFAYITHIYYPPLAWLPGVGVTVIALCYPLNHLGYYHLSRVSFSTIPISLATMYIAMITPAGEPAWGQIWVLYYMFIFIPTTIIDYKEPKLLVSMLVYGNLCFLLWYPFNNLLELPPFENLDVWKTGWFGYVTLIMALGIMLGSVITMMYRSSKAEEKALALFKKNYEIELLNAELKAVRSQFNPHFIFNAMASIQQFILSNDKLQANLYLTRFSKLIRITLQHSDRLVVNLEEEYESLLYYLEIEQMRLRQKFQFHFVHEDSLELHTIAVPSMLLQIFAENAIWHGLAPKEEGGHLWIKTLTAENGVQIVVEDDGIGREAAAIRNQSKRHQSKGMKMTEDKINLFNQNREVPMTMEIIDLYDAEGTATGTRVSIWVPIEKSEGSLIET